MRKILCLVCVFFVTSCQTERKESSPQNPLNSRDVNSKLTPPKPPTEKSLLLGMKISMANTTNTEGERLAQFFDDNLEKFKPCLKYAGKTGMIKISADFTLMTSGAIDEVQVKEILPETAQLKECFLKKIKDIAYVKVDKAVRGSLLLTTQIQTETGGVKTYQKPK